MGLALPNNSIVRLRGKTFRITADPGAHAQADGEPIPQALGGLDLSIGVLPGAIRILRPVQSMA